MTQSKGATTQTDASTPNKQVKRRPKKWQLLLLTGIALTLIPRRSSRRTDEVINNLPLKNRTDADK